jgi:hypothetical protein
MPTNLAGKLFFFFLREQSSDMATLKIVEVIHAYFISTLAGGEWSASRPGKEPLVLIG